MGEGWRGPGHQAQPGRLCTIAQLHGHHFAHGSPGVMVLPVSSQLYWVGRGSRGSSWMLGVTQAWVPVWASSLSDCLQGHLSKPLVFT